MNPLSYSPRACQFIGRHKVPGSQFKTYAIFAQPEYIHALPNAQILQRWLSDACEGWHNDADHGVGFAIVHFALDGKYLLVSRWCDANMIRHRVFSFKDSTPLTPLSDISIIACVWELKLMMAERDFWLSTVLKPESGLDESQRIDAYLNQHFIGEL
jgi:hypothetical protein